jgi:ketosteroid isomerase-like protein
MSQENVETVRRMVEAFNRGDLERALDLYDESVEVKTLLSGWVRGRDQVRAVIEQRREEMGPVQYLPEDFIDAGDIVVSIVRAVDARGRLSEIADCDFAADQLFAFVWRMRGGLVIRQEMFSSRAEALEAVGLSE